VVASGGGCERGNELWGFIKSGKIFDYLSDYHVLRTDSAF